MNMIKPRHQIFPFRCPIMKYILKNPTGKAWQKLIKTCKYFFAKYPVFPVEYLTNDRGWWKADGKHIITTQNVSKLRIFGVVICDYRLGEPNTVSKILLKIVKCDLRYLHLSDQSLTWEDYQILTASGSIKRAFLFNSTFKYSDGKDVTMDKLLENLRNLDVFQFAFKSGSKMFEKDTIKKIAEFLSCFKNQSFFLFSNVDETFDLSSFLNFLMKNEKMTVGLQYAHDLQFSPAYTQMLETCFDKLIANPSTKCSIYIHGFESDKYREYCEIRDGEN